MQQLLSRYSWPLIRLNFPRGNLRGVFEQARKMASPASLNSTGKTGDPAKGYFKSFVSLCSAPSAPRTSCEQRRVFPQVGGAAALLSSGTVFAKAAESGYGRLTRPSSPAALGLGYLFEKDESDCHLPFLLFVDYQTLSAVSRTAFRGRKDEGREEIPASVAMGRECFKIGAAYKLFSLSGNNLCNCW